MPMPMTLHVGLAVAASLSLNARRVVGHGTGVDVGGIDRAAADAAGAAAVPVPVADPNWYFTEYNWIRNGTHASTANPGT